MPITQDRMIGLIQVAIECNNLVEDLQNLIASALARKRTNPDAAATEIETLAAIALTMRPSMQSIRMLAKEEAHFTFMRIHNDRMRAYMENKRRDGGITRRWPSEEQVRHRVEANVRRMAPVEGAVGAFAGKTREEIDAMLATQNIRMDEEERKAKAAKTVSTIDPTIPIHENPELFCEHDAEAVEIKDIWDKEGSIIE